ncbi:MAG TPA: hypothetical protein VFM97_11285 [Gammaproteobacteria bacterium]|nr:hypothetical protein [Gammaproteobacteria bacterium]
MDVIDLSEIADQALICFSRPRQDLARLKVFYFAQLTFRFGHLSFRAFKFALGAFGNDAGAQCAQNILALLLCAAERLARS